MKKIISIISAITMVIIAAAPATLVVHANTEGNDPAYVFTVANDAATNPFRYRFVLLDTDSESDGSRFFVIASANYGAGPIHNAGDNSFSWDPNDTETLSGYLNQTWFNIDGGESATTDVKPVGSASGAAIYTLIPEIKSYIDQNHEWKMPGYDGLTALEKTTITCPVSVLSRDEHEAYKEIVGYVGDKAANHSNQNWLLRSPQQTAQTSGMFINPATGNRGAAQITGTYRFRPCFWLGVDFFKNVKLDLENTGDKVIEALKENYDRSELEQAGYTEDELNELYVTIDEDLIISSAVSGTARPGYTLTAEHDEPQEGVWVKYQWQQSDSENGSYANIPEATGKEYTLKNAQSEKYVRVQVRLFADGGATAGPATTSDAVAVESALTPGAADNSNGGQQAYNPTYRLTVPESVEGMTGMNETSRSYFLLDDSGTDDAKFLLIEAAGAARLINNATQGMPYSEESKYNKFDPEMEGNLAYWLKYTYAKGDTTVSEPVRNLLNNNKLAPAFIPYLDVDHEWLTEGGCTDGPCTDDYIVKSPAAILSKTELDMYRSKFGWAEGLEWESGNADFEMLRTPRQNNASVRLIWRTNDNNGAAVGGGVIANAATGTTGVMIRPIFWLSKDVFENVKLDVNTLGDGIKEMLLNTYSKSELKGLYSEAELAAIGFESISVSDVAISGIPEVGSELTVSYNYLNSNPDAAESVRIEWLFSETEGGECSVIPGAESKSYVVGEEYLNKYVTVRVTPLDSRGNEGDPVLFGSRRHIGAGAALVVKDPVFTQTDSSSTMTYTIKNKSSEEQTVLLIIASYDKTSHSMMAVKMQETTVAPGEFQYAVTLEGVGSGSDAEVRSFVWNNLTDIVPLY